MNSSFIDVSCGPFIFKEVLQISVWLDDSYILSGLAIFAVVLNHSVGQVFVAMFYWTDQYRPGVDVPNFDQIGSAAYYILRMMEQLAIFGVPAFVFISGYFIAFATPRARSTVPWSIIWGRIKNLGIPFLLWSVVYLLINMLLFVRENKPVDGYSIGGVLAALRSEYTLWEIVVQVITGRTTPAFYYIPILIQLYIISPLLIPIAKKHWKLLLIVTALLHIFIVGVLRYPQIIQMEVRYFQFFDLLNKSWVFPGFLLWFVLGIIVDSPSRRSTGSRTSAHGVTSCASQHPSTITS